MNANHTAFERVAFIGAGAVGASLAAMMIDAERPVTLVADGERADRLLDEGLTVNGRTYRPPVDRGGTGAGAPGYDLVVLATKSTHLDSALPLLVKAAGRDGFVMSLLNGISSEELIRRELARAGDGQADSVANPAARRVIPAMILGIDAMRGASGVTYLNRGTIYYGADSTRAPVDERTLEGVSATLRAGGIPAERSANIVRTLWWKFMINVGINQGSAVLRSPYGLFQRSAYARDLMLAAMEEVLALSALEGTGLIRSDVDSWLETLASLDPQGKTSMLQDVEAGRPTEVDLFAGTVIDRAERHALHVPVNETLYRIIRAMEES